MVVSIQDGKNIYRNYLPGGLWVAIIICFQQCTYTVEKPAQQKNINLITPVDHLVTVNSTQSFTWGVVQGATYYQFQLASPDFTSASYLIADTALKETAYSGVLVPGHYAWCVQAVNSSSVTVYSDTNTFTVH